MGSGVLNVGTRQTLQKSLKNAVLAAVMAGTFGLGMFMSTAGEAVSGGETRTISLVHQHTKERLTVTYKKNGKYIPSAMKQLNRFFRDWRRNEVTQISPITIDLIWELHADLGSKKPIHIVSGYRSPKTNAFLRRIGRKVAKKSQHMKGKAIDFFFPDVSTKNIRNMATARRVGGVGYYSSAGGPTGFIHADSGNVRTWGKRATPSQVAEAARKIGKRIGKRGVFEGATETASADTGTKKRGSLLSWWNGDDDIKVISKAPAPEPEAGDDEPVESIYEGDELAELSKDATAATLSEDKAAKKKLEAELKAAKIAEAKAKAEAEAEAAAVAKAEKAEALAKAKELAEAEASAKADALAKAKAKLIKKPTPVVEEDMPAFVEANPDPSLNKSDLGAMASLAGTAATEEQAEAQVVAVAVPKPKLKPKTVKLIAANAAALPDDVVIEPANAVPGQKTALKKVKLSPVVDPIGTVEAPETLLEVADDTTSNADGKSNLDADIRVASADDIVVIEPVVATKTEPSWLSSLYASAEASLRRDGVKPAPAAIATAPVAAILGPDGSGEIEITSPVAAEGKGDALTVNREGKGSLPAIKLRLSEVTE